MTKSTLKKKKVSSTNETHKKCNTKNKTLSFKDQSKENTRQKIVDLKFGEYVISNLVAVKFYQKL